METNLVQIGTTEINGTQQKTINARELWYFLESKQEFSNWIKSRVEKYGFQEGVDFNLDKIIKVQNEGGREVNREFIDYICTLDMSKELAMVENNEKGRQIRKYFIEVEKAAKEFASTREEALERSGFKDKLPKNFVEALKLLVTSEEQRLVALNEVEQSRMKLLVQAPLVAYTNTVLDSKNSMPITLIAKELGMSAQKLNDLLKAEGVQYKQGKTWLLYAKYQHRTDLVKVLTHSYVSNRGENFSSHELQWTEKGRKFIHELIKQPSLAIGG